MRQPKQMPLLLIALLVTAPLVAQEMPTPPGPGGRVPTLRSRGPFVDPSKRKRAPAEGEEEGKVLAPGARTGMDKSARDAARAAAREKAQERAAGAKGTRSAKAAAADDGADKAKAKGAKAGAKGKKEEPKPVDGEERFRKGKGYFNFEKADLLDVVKQISKLTRMNFIIPERLKTQKVTIICEKPVSTKDAYLAFLAALEINNLNLIPTGKFYKIDQRKDSVRQPIPTLMDDEEIPLDDALITAVLELNYVDVDQVQKVVQNLMSKDGTLQTLPPTMMILADSGANILRIQRILKKIDVEGSTNQVHIVDVQYAAASDIAQKLGQLFDAGKGKKGGAPIVTRRKAGSDSPTPGPATDDGEEEQVVLGKAIADDRTNKLILVASKSSFERIQEIIQILDVPVEEGTPQVHVYYLSNADSEEVSRTISTLAQGSQSRAKKGKAKAGPVGAADLFEGQVKVTADKATNSLVIVATGRDYKRLTRVIDRLDVRRPQVFVEAVIMEMSLSKHLELGLNLFTGYQAELPGVGDGYGMITNPGGQGLITNAGTAAATSAITSGSASSAVSAGNLAAFLGFLSYRGPIVPGSDSVIPGGLPSVGAVLQALQSDADVDVLSTPHILTTDNEKAEILVGQNVPFAGSISGGGGAGGMGGFFPMVSVQRQDVALKFAVTPHVSEDGQVRLEIEQEISDLGEYIDVGYGQTQPVTTKRNAKTTVVVKDQQTIILGGLVSERKNTQETKIPLLGDIPILGWAFKDHKEDTEKRNLLLVLTPYIIEGDEDFRRIYERKLAERQEFVEFFYGGEDIFSVPIEYAKKAGAYGRLHQKVDHEMQRLENGGPGFGDEIIVGPAGSASIDISPPVDGQGGDGEDGAASGGGEAKAVPTMEDLRRAPTMRPAPGPSPAPKPGAGP